ncbi:MAG: putative prokaryotic signal transducing protein [Actinomycetota bacterium]|nr:putative prokaryotic signal transducing protein [Actinomycetota bacterium]
MVPVRKVSDQFEARVLAARLGSEGIVAQLRGGGIDGPYPMGAIEVLVSEDDLDSARELLLADEVESAFDDSGDDDEGGDGVGGAGVREARMRITAIAVLACLVLGVVLRVIDMAS